MRVITAGVVELAVLSDGWLRASSVFFVDGSG